MRPWPEGARSAREEPTMPTVDLTARVARESKPQAKDTILFDRTLPGFGLRIHPSGRKVYIVQARIEGRSRRIVIARHGEMELAEARRCARDILGRIRAARTRQTTSAGRRRRRPCGSSPTSTCAAAIRTGSPRGARPCASTSRPASCPRSARCRSTASARSTWPRGSTRPARTGPARPTAPSRYCAR